MLIFLDFVLACTCKIWIGIKAFQDSQSEIAWFSLGFLFLTCDTVVLVLSKIVNLFKPLIALEMQCKL